MSYIAKIEDTYSLDELEELRRDFNNRIEKAIRKKKEIDKNLEKSKYCVKVVCTTCDGSGFEVRGGAADILSDPPEEISCEGCQCTGFVYATKFVEKGHKHRMDLDERLY